MRKIEPYDPTKCQCVEEGIRTNLVKTTHLTDPCDYCKDRSAEYVSLNKRWVGPFPQLTPEGHKNGDTRFPEYIELRRQAHRLYRHLFDCAINERDVDELGKMGQIDRLLALSHKSLQRYQRRAGYLFMPAKVVWASDVVPSHDSMPPERQAAVAILGLFEDFLSERKVTWPNDERDEAEASAVLPSEGLADGGEPYTEDELDPEPAILYGTEYYDLEDRITAILAGQEVGHATK
jgi:hypothetical protein